MIRIGTGILLMGLSFFLIGVPVEAATGTDVPLISMEEARAMLDEPDVILLDVRSDEQWRQSRLKLPGAVHEDPEDVKSWADKYPKEKTLILYCA